MAAGIVSRTVIFSSLGIFCFAGSASGSEFSTTGFVLRNHAPLIAILGIPGRWPDDSDYAADLSWNVSSHGSLETDGGDSLLLDGETQTLSLRWQSNFANRFRLGLELPWIRHSGGFLDGVIDSWHELTGLNEGIRPQVPRNDLQFVYRENDLEQFRFDDSASGPGDLRVALTADIGRLFGKIPWRLSAGVELPTGDADDLTGNGNADYSAGLGLRSPARDGSRFGWRFDVGLAWPGDVDLPVPAPSGQVFYYDVAVAWRAMPRLDLLMQVAGHSAPYQSGIKSLGDPAMQIAIGAAWYASDAWGIRAGFTEDLRAETAPDFGIEISLLIRRSL